MVGRPFISLAYGSRFLDSVVPFLILLPGVVCLGAAKVLSADLNGRGLPQYNALGALLSLVVTLGLDLVLIPRAGASGAAIASSAAYVASLIYTVAVYGRVTGLKFRSLVRFEPSDFRALRDTLARYRGVAQ